MTSAGRPRSGPSSGGATVGDWRRSCAATRLDFGRQSDCHFVRLDVERSRQSSEGEGAQVIT